MAKVWKYVKNGRVAVLISNNGSWSSLRWHDETERCRMLFDVNLVRVMLPEDEGSILCDSVYDPYSLENVLKRDFGYVYCESSCHFPNEIVWVDQGESFYIENRNGREYVITADEFIVA